jgi:hypothetical protein
MIMRNGYEAARPPEERSRLDSVGCVPYDHANAWSDHSTYLISPHLLDTFRNAFKDSERLHDAPAGREWPPIGPP